MTYALYAKSEGLYLENVRIGQFVTTRNRRDALRMTLKEAEHVQIYLFAYRFDIVPWGPQDRVDWIKEGF